MTQSRRNHLVSLYALGLALALLGATRGLCAQVAGNRVGTRNLDLRAIPCSKNEGDVLCQPTGNVYLRIRGGTLVEIDTSWTDYKSEFVSAPDIWHEMQTAIVARFGSPDSVRIMNSLKMPRAYSDGLAAFWTKPGWCEVLTIKTSAESTPHVFVSIELTVEKQGTWFVDCSVYPYVESSQ